MYFNAARLRLFLFALLALQLATWYGSLPLLRTRYIDYRSFYAAGTMVRTGQAASLYDYETERRVQNAVVGPNENALPYMPAPFTALFFVPLSLLPFRASYFVFLGLNLAFAALAVRLLRPHLTALTSRWRPLPEMLFLTFLPLGIALMFGQLSILLLLLYCT
ncbi:MAG: glycosyltransferase family 87 protein, partial [Acidobacteriaceae bacterium]